MGKTLDRSDINRLMVAIHKAIVATFTDGDWRALGFQTGTLEWVTVHRRLLRPIAKSQVSASDDLNGALDVPVECVGSGFERLLGFTRLEHLQHAHRRAE
jgi:hypothetical protein